LHSSLHLNNKSLELFFQKPAMLGHVGNQTYKIKIGLYKG
jgi:hypothetical protein